MNATKPGYATTEFWVTIMTNVVAVVSVFKPLNVEVGTLESVAAVVASIVSTVIYIISRTKVKSDEVKTTAVVK